MNNIPPECRKMKRLMGRYLLDTLRSADTTAVEKHIETCDRCREALEKERETLAVLDGLEPVEPSRDLTAAVMDRVRSGEEDMHLRISARRIHVFMYQAAAVIVIVSLLAAVLLPALSRAREGARRASSANNLKQIGLSLKMYANEYRGKFPPLAPYEGVWMMDLEAMYPEYMTDFNAFVDPDLPDRKDVLERLERMVEESPIDWEAVHRLVAKSYTYLNWAIKDDSEAVVVKKEYLQLAKGDYGNNIVTESGTFYRFKEGIERFFITDINNPAGSAQAQSIIPIMFNVRYKRGKPDQFIVLFMDGHVKTIKYGTSFPATPSVLDAFRPPEN